MITADTFTLGSRFMLPEIRIERFSCNPLMVPDPNTPWMTERVFNCGVVEDDDGIYKMLFRATFQRGDIAYTNSNLGLAWSIDGVRWRVHNTPVLRSGYNQYSIRGIEDPRIVRWNDWYYVFTTVVAESGIDNSHIGIWRTKNFFEYEWVSFPFNEIANSSAVLPEPIDGHAFLIHRRYPDIWISRTKDLSLKGGWKNHQAIIKARDLYLSPETGMSPRKIGMAAPPIKTPKGWLVLLFTAHGERFEAVYSIGFAVLDLDDPTRVKYIHPNPILYPQEPYEIRDGTRGICYCCAAAESPDHESLYVWWGAADKFIAGGKLMKENLRGICY